MSNTATQPQIDLINRLQQERVIDSELLRIGRNVWRAGIFTKEYASSMISEMLTSPRVAAETTPNDEPEAGVYRREDGELYRVYFGQKSGRMLAKHIRFIDGQVDYMYSGAARLVVKNATRLTVEEVGSIGISTGQCLMCGRRLDDPESVDRGIGPVCAAKY